MGEGCWPSLPDSGWLFTNDEAPPPQTKDDTLRSSSAAAAEWMGLEMRFMRGEIGICPLAKTPTKARKGGRKEGALLCPPG